MTETGQIVALVTVREMVASEGRPDVFLPRESSLARMMH